jgi:predicted house-cleaning NTP pyrophosphatase (Maf/HAM1 superfamily)
MEALKKIQAELKAPKGQFNSFGKYNYRSAEDILEAVKPLLSKHDALLILSDEVVEIGGRVYVKATAKITDNSDKTIEISAFAREAEKKSGMDDSQITGTASSYARKYALNGLFLIDDTKDADTDAYTQQTQPPPAPKAKAQPKAQAKPATPKKIDADTVTSIYNLIYETSSSAEKLCEYFKVSKVDELTTEQGQKCLKMLESKQNR